MKPLERIILVDDDAFTNLFNKIVLEKAKMANDIKVFQKGQEALDYLATGNDKVNLILLDINMPIMDGWQFLEEFDKLDASIKESVIVMLTSSISYHDQQRAEGIPYIKKFITKPFSPETIQQIKEFFLIL